MYFTLFILFYLFLFDYLYVFSFAELFHAVRVKTKKKEQSKRMQAATGNIKDDCTCTCHVSNDEDHYEACCRECPKCGRRITTRVDLDAHMGKCSGTQLEQRQERERV